MTLTIKAKITYWRIEKQSNGCMAIIGFEGEGGIGEDFLVFPTATEAGAWVDEQLAKEKDGDGR